VDFEQIGRFERINVVGTSGSGKSTFARELAELLNLPFYEMDQLFWKSDWHESSDNELFRKVHEGLLDQGGSSMVTTLERYRSSGNRSSW
jgi:adenylate kinase family enzyme